MRTDLLLHKSLIWPVLEYSMGVQDTNSINRHLRKFSSMPQSFSLHLMILHMNIDDALSHWTYVPLLYYSELVVKGLYDLNIINYNILTNKVNIGHD